MTTFEDLRKNLSLIFGLPETQVTAKSKELLEEMHMIYYASGGFVMSAYTLEQVIEALNRLIAEYPVSGQITLAALSNREPELSKRFLELLIKGE